MEHFFFFWNWPDISENYILCKDEGFWCLVGVNHYSFTQSIIFGKIKKKSFKRKPFKEQAWIFFWEDILSFVQFRPFGSIWDIHLLLQLSFFISPRSVALSSVARILLLIQRTVKINQPKIYCREHTFDFFLASPSDISFF